MVKKMNAAKLWPVLSYFILAVIISWGGILLVLGPGGFTGAVKATDAQLPFLFLAMFAGPSVSGILLTGLVNGREGLRGMLSRLGKWRVGAGWYIIACLTAPIMMVMILLGLSLISRGFLPGIFTSADKGSLIMMGIGAGLMTGFFEELGWTGFAVPGLRKRYGIIPTGMIVGVIWGLWHYPLFSGGDASGSVPPVLFIPVLLFSHLPAFRVLMVWVYDRTGSLLAALLMHGGLTASTLVFQPRGSSGIYVLVHNLVLAAVLWIVIAVVLRKGREKKSR